MASLKYKGQSLGGGGGQDATVNGVNDLTVVAGENVTIEQRESTLYISAYGGEPVPSTPGVYGVSWDGTASTLWTRTDDAALFPDPVPYTTGMLTAECSSPFDNIMPWAGMVVSERVAGRMVSIPKFYYSLTQEGAGLSIKISMTQQDGFSCSPAHMDRGDGKGERDVVYIGRYHCASDYKSKTGVLPISSITRSAARTAIHALGDTIWQWDFATFFTIWLLYLVEFANWDSQSVIGYGCGNGSSVQSMGASDSMPYHTGTMQSGRTTCGVGVQYRNIEGLWDNISDWIDGCYYNGSGLNLILNPSSFSDSENGVSVGVPSSGYPSAFSTSNTGGYQTFYPTAASGSNATYSCDSWNFDASYPCLCVGGSYDQELARGLFFFYYKTASYAQSDVGTRLMELPDPT